MKEKDSLELVMDQVLHATDLWQYFWMELKDREDPLPTTPELLRFLTLAKLKLVPITDEEEFLMPSAWAHLANRHLDWQVQETLHKDGFYK